MAKQDAVTEAAAPTRLDLKQEYKYLYQAQAKQTTLIEVPPLTYLMIDGRGNPNTSQSYQDALGALYNLAYTLRFMIKKTLGIDYPVMALEGLWWTDDMQHFSMDAKDSWYWTMMIMQPPCVTPELAREAAEQVQKKKVVADLAKIRLADLHEGRSAQIMHLGPYATEGPTIARLHDFIRENGYELRGEHHEIYLGDPRRTAPERLRTIIRQPVK
jgi:hypothetical protein